MQTWPTHRRTGSEPIEADGPGISKTHLPHACPSRRPRPCPRIGLRCAARARCSGAVAPVPPVRDRARYHPGTGTPFDVTSTPLRKRRVGPGSGDWRPGRRRCRQRARGVLTRCSALPSSNRGKPETVTMITNGARQVWPETPAARATWWTPAAPPAPRNPRGAPDRWATAEAAPRDDVSLISHLKRSANALCIVLTTAWPRYRRPSSNSPPSLLQDALKSAAIR